MSALVVDGGIVHYEVFGRGKPVLFLHGWLGSWRYWVPTMEAISDKYRAYALDLWGFGDSDKSRPRYRVPDYVALVDGFVSHLGISQAPLIGHALGAGVALEYALGYPDRVKKLMLVSLPLTPESITRRLIDIANNSIMAKMLWWRQIPYAEVQREAEKTGPDAISLSVESVAQINVQGHIQQISRSEASMLLAVYGEKDDMIDPGAIRSLNGRWPNVRPIGLSGSKHFPMLDEAAKFNRLVKDFLDVEKDLSNLALKEEWRRRTR